MKLEVHRNGVKLFFLTFAVEGRRPLLSRLVDGENRPVLLPLGELVKAGLLAIHKHYPAAGISDFVIMPDHVHFLMVVDYRHTATFNPLWVVHRLMDAVEAAWNERENTPASPDMVAHFATALARGRERAANLRRAERAPVSSAEPCAEPVGFGAASPVRSIPPSPVPIFERSPYIELAFDPRQLKAIRR